MNGSGSGAVILDQDQLRLLRDDHGLVPGAVEELLRFDPPIQLSSRVPTVDLEIDGTLLPAGQPVSLMLAGANRDPAVFTDPDRLDITRPDARKHLSFAAGPHHSQPRRQPTLGTIPSRAVLGSPKTASRSARDSESCRWATPQQRRRRRPVPTDTIRHLRKSPDAIRQSAALTPAHNNPPALRRAS